MKKLLITFGALIILTSCGYSSEEECRLKEMQKCNDAATCESQVWSYCDAEFPAEKTWDIYKKAPKSWVNIEVDSYRIKFKPSTYRYETIKVCLKKNWSLRKGRCAKMSLNQYSSSKNGTGWTESDSDRDYFYDYINLDGDGLKENTKVVVEIIAAIDFSWKDSVKSCIPQTHHREIVEDSGSIKIFCRCPQPTDVEGSQ